MEKNVLSLVNTLCAQPLLQFYVNYFETLQILWSWLEEMHVVLHKPQYNMYMLILFSFYEQRDFEPPMLDLHCVRNFCSVFTDFLYLCTFALV